MSKFVRMCITNNFIIHHIKTVHFDLTQSSSAVDVYMYFFTKKLIPRIKY